VNTLDAHGVLRSALLRGRHGAKKTGKTIAFRCPRHADSTASAWLGDHAWGCSACGFTEGLHTLAETLGVELPKAEASATGLTVAEYAERKGLALDGLAKAGVHDRLGKFNDAIVAIPYRRADGTVIRTKCRTRKGTFWLPDGEGTPLYGQDILAAHPDAPVVIVEGESDCHAGWQRGLCVVGLPGASMWKPEYSELLTNRMVYVWQEPDEGGATLVAAVAKSLPKAVVLRDVRYRGTPIKDLCDLHQSVQQHGDSWTLAWQEIIRQATPIGAEGPVVAFDSLTGDTLLQIGDEKMAPIDAVPTCLPGWNAVCGNGGGGVGLARGWFIIIGGNTGSGKSLVALNLAAAAAESGEVPVDISLEMSRSELATRYLSIVSGETIGLLEQGPRFDPEMYMKAVRSVNQVRERTGGHLLVNRKPVTRLRDVVACIKHYHENHGSRWFVVDYLQLIRTIDSHDVNTRMEAVSDAMRSLAQELRIVIVGISQFNRQTSANREERPTSQGLMGSSALENDSAQVWLLDHSRFMRAGNIGETWLLGDKNRHGQLLDLPILWDYRTMRLLPRTVTTTESEQKHGALSRRGRGF
jgi:KaiC/GvpD/RAD55 family RecA-like ATPase